MKTTPIALVEKNGLVVRPTGAAPARGSRPLEGQVGGRTTKTAANGSYVVRVAGWVHVFDAASVALVKIRSAQLVPAEDGQDVEAGETQDGLLPCEVASEEQVNRVVEAPERAHDADHDQHHGKEVALLAHGSDRLGQFGPDALPVFGTKVTARELATAFLFDASAVRHWDAVVAPLIDRPLGKTKAPDQPGLKTLLVKK